MCSIIQESNYLDIHPQALPSQTTKPPWAGEEGSRGEGMYLVHWYCYGTHLCCAMHKASKATCRCWPLCEHWAHTPSSTPWKSTYPSPASSLAWPPRLHCLLHSSSLVSQIQPQPFSLLLHGGTRLPPQKWFCQLCCGSDLYVKFPLQVWDSRRHCTLAPSTRQGKNRGML